MEVPRYITGISREDLKRIFEMANVKVGQGIVMKYEADGLYISVDQMCLKQWMRNFSDNGGFTCSEADVNGIPFTKVS